MITLILGSTTKRSNDLYEPSFTWSESVNAEIRGEISLTSPDFDIAHGSESVLSANMLYVRVWQRYYFISEISVDGNHIYLHCVEDYLASWYSDITGSTFYCVRSTSTYDDDLTDTVFPAHNFGAFYSYPVLNPWSGLTSGEYVIAISSGGNSTPHIGTNSYYILKQSEMTSFMDDLMGKAEFSFSGIAESITKAIVNPMQYIKSCIWFPFAVTGNTIEVSKIDFGWWDADTNARVLDLTQASDTYTELTVEFPYTDDFFSSTNASYQKYPPYSRYIITAWPFGTIELPSTLITSFINGNSIVLDIYVDTITGMGTLLVRSSDHETPFFTTTAQIGVSIPVGQVLQDFAGAMIQTASSAGQLFSGNVIGAASGVYSALDSITPEVTVSGASGGFAQLMLNKNWRLTREYWSATINDEFLGRPCCKNCKVSALSGYAEFANVDMQGSMLDSEKTEIKKLLETGIFIG